MTNAVSIAQYGTNNPSWRNRIINGDMRIDQRNAGASVTPLGGQYIVDRFEFASTQASKFSAQQNAGAVTPPSGFTNYLGFTSLSAYSPTSSDYFLVRQNIEGFNVADLGWGAAGAQTVTLTFWVRSSLTGTHSGSIYNADGSRSYVFAFTVSASNTWEFKTVVIPGDTTGTWNKTNSTGIRVHFGLGTGSSFLTSPGSWSSVLYLGATGAVNVCATNGATFYITGVQLEAGSTATPFERRPYGTELSLCQRYYWRPLPFPGVGCGQSAAQIARMRASTPVSMRAAPTLTLVGQPSLYNGGGAGSLTGLSTNYSSPDAVEFDGTASTSMTLYACVVVYNNYDGATIAASAEL